MEFSRRRPRSELRTELRHLLTRPGPYLSVYLNVFDSPLPPGARLDAALRETDVSDATLAAAASKLQSIDLTTESGLLAMIVAADGTAVASTFPDPPIDDVVRVDEIPTLGPFIEADQILLHHVVVVVDDRGLSISAFARSGEISEQHLEGGDLRSAASVIDRVARETDTSLVVVCGAPDTLDQLVVHLAPMLPISIFLSRVEIDSPTDDLGNEVVRTVADRSARRTVEMIRIWRYHRSQGEGVDGIEATLDAFRREAVSLLLVHDDPSDDRRAWFGDGIDLLATEPPLEPEQHAGAREGRVVDLLLSLAIAREVPVFLVPSVPADVLADGIGVIVSDGLSTADGLGRAIER